MEEYHGLRSLSKVFTWRMALFLIALAGAVVLSIQQPASLVEIFPSSGEMLTRLWLACSLIGMLFITFFASDELAGESLDRTLPEGSHKDTSAKYAKSASRANLAFAIYLTSALFITFSSWARIDFVALLCGAGVMLWVMVFDLCLLRADASALLALRGSVRPVSPELLRRVETCLDRDRRLLWQLDVPILVGVLVTFFVGLIIVPNSGPDETKEVREMMMTYAIGFTGGATALQVIAGNIEFEIIKAMQATGVVTK